MHLKWFNRSLTATHLTEFERSVSLAARSAMGSGGDAIDGDGGCGGGRSGDSSGSSSSNGCPGAMVAAASVGGHS
jgi:hypothetical protein